MGEASVLAQTVAAFETALDAAVAAVVAGDYDLARSSLLQAAIIQVSLPRTWIDGAMVDYRGKIEEVNRILDATESHANRSSRRMITFRTAHSRRTGRGGRGPCVDPTC